MLNIIRSFIFLLVLAIPTKQQNDPRQPCKGVFEYAPLGKEPGRWYGTIHLSTDTPLRSVWLDIELDSKADLLGNWFGDVTSNDNINYRIENTVKKILPDSPVDVRIFVQYNVLNQTPQIQSIRFNGREICNANNKVVIGHQTSLPAIKPVAPQSPREPSEGTVPHTAYDSKIQCGKVILNAKPLVVEGEPTLEGQWPWQIALYQTKINLMLTSKNRPLQLYWAKGPSTLGAQTASYELDDKARAPLSIRTLTWADTGEKNCDDLLFTNSNFICGGTLLTHRHVLTAAHCTTEKSTRRLHDKNTLIVFLGRHNLQTSIHGVQTRFVDNLLIHPEYSPKSFDHDVSIITLIEQVTYTDKIQPACLWPENLIPLNNVIGKNGSVVGWGFDSTRKLTEELNLVRMQVVDGETCLRSKNEFYNRFTSSFSYCAGNRDGSSVCNGDSGGGMMFKLDDETWHIRGIVSLSIAAMDDNTCDPNYYVIFADVAKHLTWIKANIFDY